MQITSPKSPTLVTVPKAQVEEKPRTYTIDLPSKGQLYDGKSTLEISFLTTKDIKRLYDIQKGTRTDTIEKLIGSKILDFDVNKLTMSDFWYVVYWIRINSFDKYPLEVNWVCKNYVSKDGDRVPCDTSQSSVISGSSLQIQEIDKDYKEPAILNLEGRDPINLKLVKIGDYVLAEKLKEAQFKGKMSESDSWFLDKALLIDNGESLYSNFLMISKFTPEEIFLLDSFEKEYNYGISNTVKVVCKSCQEVSFIPFQLTISEFFPSMQHSGRIRDAIRFSS